MRDYCFTCGHLDTDHDPECWMMGCECREFVKVKSKGPRQ